MSLSSGEKTTQEKNLETAIEAAKAGRDTRVVCSKCNNTQRSIFRKARCFRCWARFHIRKREVMNYTSTDWYGWNEKEFIEYLQHRYNSMAAGGEPFDPLKDIADIFRLEQRSVPWRTYYCKNRIYRAMSRVVDYIDKVGSEEYEKTNSGYV